MVASWVSTLRGGGGGGGGGSSTNNVRWKDIWLGCGTGLVAFPTVLALLQRRVLVPLRIRAHHRVLGTLAGLASVSTAGIAATAASSAAFEYAPALRREVLSPAPDRSSRLMQWAKEVADDALAACSRLPQTVPAKLEAYKSLAYLALEEPRLFAEEVTSSRGFKFATIVSVSTLCTFFLLGGRPRRVLPSCLWHQGAFACEGLPARSANYATQSERALLINMGHTYGCHSCGTRRAAMFVGDHMPPNKLANGRPQRFLPQCESCSSMQGASLSSMTKRAITHGASLRLYHVWLPLPWFLSFVLLTATSQPREKRQTSVLDGARELFSSLSPSLSSSSSSSPFTSSNDQVSVPSLPPFPWFPTSQSSGNSSGRETPTWAEIASRLDTLRQHATLAFVICFIYLEAVSQTVVVEFAQKLSEVLGSQSGNEASSAGLHGASQPPALPGAAAPPAEEEAPGLGVGVGGAEPASHDRPSVGIADAVRAAFAGGRGRGEEGEAANCGGDGDKQQQQERSWWQWKTNAAEGHAETEAETKGAERDTKRTRSGRAGVSQLFPAEEVVLSVQHTLLSDTRGLHRAPREPLLSAEEHMAKALRRVQKEGAARGAKQRRAEELLEDDLAMLGVEIRLLREEDGDEEEGRATQR